ncbi:hypothetical protein GV828_08440 [Flavobacterium sp. NST-5]|uniref:Uncharacterized protein n=1 Tax=Flavobacterium ichthyis TaxID=2698827 RepID=A0ABW9Z923_9FLAO|nr:hypothetical protein [Flavobacterium ichthyis]NBL65221.1 hypothetical protein [Flavobacterium ichthyis]
MKNKNLKYSLIALSVLILALLYVYVFPNKTPFNEPGNFWKASSKPVLGDVVHISKEEAKLYNDTLYVNEIPRALIIKVENNFWAGTRTLEIKNLQTGSTGTYVEK